MAHLSFSSKFGGRGFCDCLESEPACMVPATPLSEKQKIVKLIMTSRNFFFDHFICNICSIIKPESH